MKAVEHPLNTRIAPDQPMSLFGAVARHNCELNQKKINHRTGPRLKTLTDSPIADSGDPKKFCLLTLQYLTQGHQGLRTCLMIWNYEATSH